MELFRVFYINQLGLNFYISVPIKSLCYEMDMVPAHSIVLT